ncbi:MAG: hypothetical protein J2P25_24585 [Nocardiopsaceae bacterium]|nr:hypothetical protein [Nocardiopsaceae bacterium]
MDPEIEELFAPIAPPAAFGMVLSEARDVLPDVREPIDAELWGSDMLGALSRSAREPADLMSELATSLVPAAEEEATPEALALLRILEALGSAEMRKTATQSAERIVASGISDPAWASGLGAPTPGDCWHYGDVSGQQESVTATFAYGEKEHALSVLIDHTKGGKIRDVWVGDATGLLDRTWLVAENDPGVVFERIDAADAGERLRRAIEAGEAPVKQDETDDITAHRALLHSRVALLTAIQ